MRDSYSVATASLIDMIENMAVPESVYSELALYKHFLVYLLARDPLAVLDGEWIGEDGQYVNVRKDGAYFKPAECPPSHSPVGPFPLKMDKAVGSLTLCMMDGHLRSLEWNNDVVVWNNDADDGCAVVWTRPDTHESQLVQHAPALLFLSALSEKLLRENGCGRRENMTQLLSSLSKYKKILPKEATSSIFRLLNFISSKISNVAGATPHSDLIEAGSLVRGALAALRSDECLEWIMTNAQRHVDTCAHQYRFIYDLRNDPTNIMLLEKATEMYAVFKERNLLQTASLSTTAIKDGYSDLEAKLRRAENELLSRQPIETIPKERLLKGYSELDASQASEDLLEMMPEFRGTWGDVPLFRFLLDLRISRWIAETKASDNALRRLPPAAVVKKFSSQAVELFRKEIPTIIWLGRLLLNVLVGDVDIEAFRAYNELLPKDVVTSIKIVAKHVRDGTFTTDTNLNVGQLVRQCSLNVTEAITAVKQVPFFNWVTHALTQDEPVHPTMQLLRNEPTNPDNLYEVHELPLYHNLCQRAKPYFENLPTLQNLSSLTKEYPSLANLVSDDDRAGLVAKLLRGREQLTMRQLVDELRAEALQRSKEADISAMWDAPKPRAKKKRKNKQKKRFGAPPATDSNSANVVVQKAECQIDGAVNTTPEREDSEETTRIKPPASSLPPAVLEEILSFKISNLEPLASRLEALETSPNAERLVLLIWRDGQWRPVAAEREPFDITTGDIIETDAGKTGVVLYILEGTGSPRYKIKWSSKSSGWIGASEIVNVTPGSPRDATDSNGTDSDAVDFDTLTSFDSYFDLPPPRIDFDVPPPPVDEHPWSRLHRSGVDMAEIHSSWRDSEGKPFSWHWPPWLDGPYRDVDWNSLTAGAFPDWLAYAHYVRAPPPAWFLDAYTQSQSLPLAIPTAQLLQVEPKNGWKNPETCSDSGSTGTESTNTESTQVSIERPETLPATKEAMIRAIYLAKPRLPPNLVQKFDAATISRIYEALGE